MAIYYPGCDTDELPEHQCDPCNDFEKGRVRSSGFVTSAYKPTIDANPTLTSAWTAGIESGDIIIIAEVIGSLDVPDPITGPGYGNNVETILGTDYTLSFRDPSYKSNCVFYNTLKRQTGKWHAIYRTGSQTHISNETTTIGIKAPITENLEDNLEWVVSAKWRGQDQPCPFDTPEGVFECFGITA